jgi:hypothetical protein
MSEEDKKDITTRMCEDLLALYHKMKKDTLQEGETHGGCHEIDVSNMVKRALWREGNDSVTLKISKGSDDYHILIEVKELKKNNEQ